MYVTLWCAEHQNADTRLLAEPKTILYWVYKREKRKCFKWKKNSVLKLKVHGKWSYGRVSKNQKQKIHSGDLWHPLSRRRQANTQRLSNGDHLTASIYQWVMSWSLALQKPGSQCHLRGKPGMSHTHQWGLATRILTLSMLRNDIQPSLQFERAELETPDCIVLQLHPNCLRESAYLYNLNLLHH